MILPTKHISLHNSYLGAGKTVLMALDKPLPVLALWRKVCAEENIVTPQRFFKVLDLLFMMGAIDLVNRKIAKVSHAA